MDDDDKARRNLMVLAAAILVYAWLELPPSFLMDRIFTDKFAAAVAKWKVWAALLLLLAYQMHRFWAVGRLGSEWAQAWQTFHHFLDERLRQCAQRDIELQRSGKSLGLVKSTPPARYKDRHTGGTLAPAPAVERRKIVTFERPAGEDYWYRLLKVADIDEVAVNVEKAFPLHFDIPRRWRWKFGILPALRIIPTPHFSNVWLPYLVGYFAMCVVAFRLSEAVLAVI